MPVEQQLLSNPKMAAHYDAVTWLFVSRNFKDDAKDREAARTHDRFSVTSWPQLLLFDPRDDKVLAEMPRGFEPWVRALQPLRQSVPAPAAADRQALAELARAQKLAATDRQAAAALAARLAATEDGAGAWLMARELLRELRADTRSLAECLRDPDVRQRALALERLLDDAKADAASWREPVSQRLLDPAESIVVRLRALAWLAKNGPELVAANAAALLAVNNDAFRNLVLDVVAAHPDPALGPQLARLFAEAGRAIESRNPNVLRGHVARCLPGSGDASAIAATAALVREANPRNSTTRVVVQALGGLAPRLAAADRARLVALLLEALPTALGEDAKDNEQRMSLALAAEVRTALAAAAGEPLPELPVEWLEAGREQWLQAARRAVSR